MTSENWLAWQNLGTAHFANGDHAAGVRAFEKAVRLQPRDLVSWMNLGAGYRAAPFIFFHTKWNWSRPNHMFVPAAVRVYS